MIERLNRLLEKKEVQIALFEEEREKIKEDEPRPEKCDLCGYKKIYKDGSYLIRPKRLFDLLRRRSEPVIMPQFACANCGHSLYLEADRALFFPGEGK